MSNLHSDGWSDDVKVLFDDLIESGLTDDALEEALQSGIAELQNSADYTDYFEVAVDLPDDVDYKKWNRKWFRPKVVKNKYAYYYSELAKKIDPARFRKMMDEKKQNRTK